MNPTANDQNKPVVLISITPLYKSFKFLAGMGFLALIILGFGLMTILQRYTTSPKFTPVAEITREKATKPLKGLIGTVLAVDGKQNMITVKSKDGSQSYPVSNDVLISQMILGIKSEEMKQFTIPTEILYLEDLKKKKGVEVYLVFDAKSQNVTQIQMYPKK